LQDFEPKAMIVNLLASEGYPDVFNAVRAIRDGLTESVTLEQIDKFIGAEIWKFR
jgi:hypothetical protein